MSVFLKDSNTTTLIIFNSIIIATHAAFQQACVQMRHHIITEEYYAAWLVSDMGVQFYDALRAGDLETVNNITDLYSINDGQSYSTFTVEAISDRTIRVLNRDVVKSAGRCPSCNKGRMECTRSVCRSCFNGRICADCIPSESVSYDPVDMYLVGVETNPGPTTRTCGTCGVRRKTNITTCKYCKCYTCINCWSGGTRICNSCAVVGVTTRDDKATLCDVMVGEGPYSFGHGFAMILYIPCAMIGCVLRLVGIELNPGPKTTGGYYCKMKISAVHMPEGQTLPDVKKSKRCVVNYQTEANFKIHQGDDGHIAPFINAMLGGDRRAWAVYDVEFLEMSKANRSKYTIPIYTPEEEDIIPALPYIEDVVPSPHSVGIEVNPGPTLLDRMIEINKGRYGMTFVDNCDPDLIQLVNDGLVYSFEHGYFRAFAADCPSKVEFVKRVLGDSTLSKDTRCFLLQWNIGYAQRLVHLEDVPNKVKEAIKTGYMDQEGNLNYNIPPAERLVGIELNPGPSEWFYELNKWRYTDDTKNVVEIEINSKTHGIKLCKLDAEDWFGTNGMWFELRQLNWYIRHSAAKSKTFYVSTDIPKHLMKTYHGFMKRSRSVIMHKLIVGGDEEIDHVDRDGTHNCKANLWPSTRVMQMHNRNKLSTNTSGVNGVCLLKRKAGSLYRVSVEKDGFRHEKQIYFGRKRTKEEAFTLAIESQKEMQLKYESTNGQDIPAARLVGIELNPGPRASAGTDTDTAVGSIDDPIVVDDDTSMYCPGVFMDGVVFEECRFPLGQCPFHAFLVRMAVGMSTQVMCPCCSDYTAVLSCPSCQQEVCIRCYVNGLCIMCQEQCVVCGQLDAGCGMEYRGNHLCERCACGGKFSFDRMDVDIPAARLVGIEENPGPIPGYMKLKMEEDMLATFMDNVEYLQRTGDKFSKTLAETAVLSIKNKDLQMQALQRTLAALQLDYDRTLLKLDVARAKLAAIPLVGIELNPGPIAARCIIDKHTMIHVSGASLFPGTGCHCCHRAFQISYLCCGNCNRIACVDCMATGLVPPPNYDVPAAPLVGVELNPGPTIMDPFYRLLQDVPIAPTFSTYDRVVGLTIQQKKALTDYEKEREFYMAAAKRCYNSLTAKEICDWLQQSGEVERKKFIIWTEKYCNAVEVMAINQHLVDQINIALPEDLTTQFQQQLF